MRSGGWRGQGSTEAETWQGWAWADEDFGPK